MQRRTILKVIGGSLVAVAGVSTTFLTTRDPARARAPWAAASNETDPRLFVLRHAILAPNPHNRQPWMITLDGTDGATIYCDLERRLPETDPFDRQIVIGFGCFLEVAHIAAAERGIDLAISYFPEGEPEDRLDGRPIARLKFISAAAVARDPLFAHVTRRRSVKEAFDVTKQVEAAAFQILTRNSTTVAIAGSIAADLVAKLRTLTWEAWAAEAATDATWLESVNLMRIGKAEIEANPDGIDLGGPLFDSLRLVGLIDRPQISDRSTQAYKGGEDSYRSIMTTSMGFLWWTTTANSRIEQLEAGRSYVRTHLTATGLGLGLHPISQCLQEFPAMRPHFDGVHALLGVDSPGRIQMLARLGYAAVKLPPAPRWPLEAKLKAA